MRVRGVLAVAAAVLLSGCAKPIARPARQFAVEAPRAWRGGEAGPSASGVDWWAYFGDSGLDRVIREALTKNADLRAAAARIEAARQETRIAAAAELPELSLSANRSRQRQNFVGLPFPGLGGRVLSATNTNTGLSLNLTWEADIWKRIEAGKLAVTANLEGREADLAAARLSLSGQAAKAWFAAVEAERQAGIAKASLASYETSAERVRARYSAGLRPSLDLRLALSEIDRAQALVKQREQQRDAFTRQVEALMGRYPAGDHAPAEDLPDVPPQIPAGLPSELVHRRPDLIAAERALLAADARIVEAKAALRPSFSLTSGLGTASNKLADLLNPNVQVWNYVTNVVMPIFNNGRLKAGVRANEARAMEAAANYESRILAAYREVETALAAEALLAEREQALESATRNALAARDLAEQRYRAGLSDIITVLSSQRTALDSESALLALRRARLDNRVDLHLALGGGFAAAAPAAASGAGDSAE